MVYGFDSNPIKCYITWEHKTKVDIKIIGGNRLSSQHQYISDFSFSKETKQVYPKKMHKNYLVEFGTIPYFEFIGE